MASNVILKASGLVTSPNELDRKEGALIEASNVIIRRSNIIEQRRGFNLYGSPLPDSAARVKQLTTYRNRIIRHYLNKLQFDSNGQGKFLDFAGSFMETMPGLRMKFVESNGNMYFTSSDGIKKISAKNSGEFSTDPGYIVDAGAVKAVDMTGKVIYNPGSQSAWLPQDAAVAYRVVWAYNDSNNNLITGAPSQRLVISNPMLSTLIRDYTRVLSTIDNFDNTPTTTARINQKDYVKSLGLTLNSSALDLRNNLIALSAKLDNDIQFASQAGSTPLLISSAAIASGICTITFTGSVPVYLVPGSKVMLSGFSPATGTLNGAQTIVSTTSTTATFNTAATGTVTLTSATIFSNEFRSLIAPDVPETPATNDELMQLQDYLETIIDTMVDQEDSVLNFDSKQEIGAIEVTTTATTEITITIPQGIDSKYFFQVYRSSVSQATGAATFDDVVPSDELQLVYEAYPTAAQLEAGSITFEDVTPDAFRGANLYTNASTGEGILQANDTPPFAHDINRYRNCVFYANTRTKQRMDLSLLGVTQMIADYDAGIIPKITITDGVITNTYKFIVGQQEINKITTVADVSGSLNSKYFFISSVSTDYYVWFNVAGAGVDPLISNRTGIEVKLATNDSDNAVLNKLYSALSVLLDSFIITQVDSNKIDVINYQVGVAKDAEDVDTGFTITKTQDGRSERVQPQITEVITIPASDFTQVGAADYITFNTTLDVDMYYLWFKVGASVDPAVYGRKPLVVELDGSETASVVADKIKAAIPSTQFDVDVVGSTIKITNYQYGETTAAADFVVDTDFKVTMLQEGALEVLLSPLVSPARAVDETARSFIRVINKNPGESVYGYYLSSAFDVPGKMNLESRQLLDDGPFYIVANNDSVGASFNPNIGPDGFITSIESVTGGTKITTDTPHGLESGDQVIMTGTDSVGPVDGLFTVTKVSDTEYTITKIISINGSEGSFIRATAAVFSENEERSNRIYYSKYLQPEAVPIANFFDVGAQDKAILRIVPLRDSLFVMKEDGLYRISGESAPFQLELFDNSFVILAADSAAVCNNVIYTWTTQGIQGLSEGGSSIISRDIDNTILKIQSSNYPSFKTATWGVGYESDNAYYVGTVDDVEDTVSTIIYRYSTLTNSWTTFDMAKNAGVINPADDKLYLAPSDVPYIEQERKTFSRLDYADREIDTVLSTGNIIDKTIIVPSVAGLEVGDVLTQEQSITMFNFETLLTQLDSDTGVHDNDYITLALSIGSSPVVNLLQLAQKLDSDSGVDYSGFETIVSAKSGTITGVTVANSTIITSVGHGLITGRIVTIVDSQTVPSIDGSHQVTVIDADRFRIEAQVKNNIVGGDWSTDNTDVRDYQATHNAMIDILNSDTKVSFNSYSKINSLTLMESIITSINSITKKITVNLALEYLAGDIKFFKAIKSTYTYSPCTFGDPLMLKHIREATIMFETRTLTGGVLSFATDLLPELIPVEFKLDGNGIFGHVPNFGDGFFGGRSNSAPFRTYIPRQCQRCRYILVQFTHKTAREDYRVNGCTLTGEVGQSTRAYR